MLPYRDGTRQSSDDRAPNTKHITSWTFTIFSPPRFALFLPLLRAVTPPPGPVNIHLVVSISALINTTTTSTTLTTLRPHRQRRPRWRPGRQLQHSPGPHAAPPPSTRSPVTTPGDADRGAVARGAAARVVHAERPAFGRVGHGDEEFLGGEGVGYYGAGLWL